MGIDWTFAGEAVEYGGFLVRATAVFVSLGGMLVTALMLGIVSGAHKAPSALREVQQIPHGALYSPSSDLEAQTIAFCGSQIQCADCRKML